MMLNAFLLGLATGAFCLGYCGPVLAGLLLSREERRWRSSIAALGVFLWGRLFAYLLFGVISYLLGELLRGRMVVAVILPAGEVLLGGLMVAYAVNLRFPHWTFCRFALQWSDSRWTLFAAGVFTGLNLCPPFILALGTALGADSLLTSILFFLSFFSATSLYLLPVLFAPLTARSANLRAAAQVVCGCVGVWYLMNGLRKFFWL